MRYLQLVVVLSVVAIEVDSDVCGSYANGCSIPLNLPFFYKGTFRSACNHHDICYGCVRVFVRCLLVGVFVSFCLAGPTSRLVDRGIGHMKLKSAQ